MAVYRSRLLQIQYILENALFNLDSKFNNTETIQACIKDCVDMAVNTCQLDSNGKPIFEHGPLSNPDLENARLVTNAVCAKILNIEHIPTPVSRSEVDQRMNQLSWYQQLFNNSASIRDTETTFSQSYPDDAGKHHDPFSNSSSSLPEESKRVIR